MTLLVHFATYEFLQGKKMRVISEIESHLATAEKRKVENYTFALFQSESKLQSQI